MSQKERLEELVDKIVTSLPDQPNSAQVLDAVHRGVYGGFAIGTTAGANHMANVIDLVTNPRARP